ncbi:MAG: hypothetical protein ACSHYB_09950 [Roseibacillus sp.]
MTRVLRQALFFVSLALSCLAEPLPDSDASTKLNYETLEVQKSLFGDFSMLLQERDDYATTLTRFALENAHNAPGDKENMSGVRRLIALALHLSPRNRTAVVSNHQLGKGLLPEQKEGDYSRAVFARLLLTRGRLLKKQTAKNDQFVGRCFVELAAELDARNEEAVYDSEIQKLDEEDVDWSVFVTSAKTE